MEFHPLAEIFPMMSAEEFAALRDDIAKHGLHEPITIANGKIIDGRNRYNACRELGIEPIYRLLEGWPYGSDCHITEGIGGDNEEDLVENLSLLNPRECNDGDLLRFIVSMNLYRRHLSQAQKREVGQRLLEMTDWSQHEIAKRLAVTQQAVSNWERDLSNKSLLDRDIRTITRGGTIYTMDVGSIGRLSQQRPDAEPFPKEIVRDRIEKGNGVVECARCHNLYDGSNIDFCPYCAYTQEERIAYLRGEGQTRTPHVSHSSGDNEWYTPKEIIEAARVVLNEIELDPASTAEANIVIKAQRFYSPEDDGLAQDWQGKTWMNPPYSQPLIGQFVNKLVRHLQLGDISEAIVLVNNATETQWFFKLINAASAVCFPQGRVKFWAPDKNTAAPLQGQAIIYIGDNAGAFLQEFKRFGWIAQVVSQSN